MGVEGVINAEPAEYAPAVNTPPSASTAGTAEQSATRDGVVEGSTILTCYPHFNFHTIWRNTTKQSSSIIIRHLPRIK